MSIVDSKPTKTVPETEDNAQPMSVQWGWRDWLVLAVFVALTIVVGWPIIPLSKAASELHPNDATIFAYILGWGADNWWRHPLDYFNFPAFYPHIMGLTNTDGLVLPSILMTPVWLLSRNAILTYNLALYLSIWFTLAAFYAALRFSTSLPRLAIAVGAVCMTINASRYWRSAGHMNLVWTGILAIGFLAGWQLARRPNWKSAVAAAATALSALCFSWYLLVLTGFCAAGGVLAWYLSTWSLPCRNFFIWTGAAMPLAALLISPIAIVYAKAASGIPRSRGDLAECQAYSASLKGWFLPPDQPGRLVTAMGPWANAPFAPPAKGEDCQFIGYGLAVLLLVEIARLIRKAVLRRMSAMDRLSMFSVFCAIAAFAFSLGPFWGPSQTPAPYYYLHELVLRHTSFFRVPARFAFVFQFFSAISVAILMAALLRRWRAAGWITCVSVVLIIFAEHRPTQFLFRNPSTKLPDAISHINTLDPTGTQPFVFLPDPGDCSAGLAGAPVWRPMLNGWADTGLFPDYDIMMNILKEFPSLRALAWIESKGVPWVVTSPAVPPEMVRAIGYMEEVRPGANSTLWKFKNPGQASKDWENVREGIAQKVHAFREAHAKDNPIVTLADYSKTGEFKVWPIDSEVEMVPMQGLIVRPKLAGGGFAMAPLPGLPTEAVDEVELTLECDADLDGKLLYTYWRSIGQGDSEKQVYKGLLQKTATPGTYVGVVRVAEHPNWFHCKTIEVLRFNISGYVPSPDMKMIIKKVAARRNPGMPKIPL
ncbi:MAG: hypothetical protein K1X53_17495 [Candidatus Sumerlaeaceae bacterium]|nr:hypothetical protein [Candidatus Sumerlaeaceae bacterium]